MRCERKPSSSQRCRLPGADRWSGSCALARGTDAQRLGEIWIAGTQLVLLARAMDKEGLDAVLAANKDDETKATSMTSGSAHIPASAFEKEVPVRLSASCSGGQVWCPEHGTWEADPLRLKRAVREARVLRSLQKVGVKPPVHR